jgi:hypothetical protein
MGDGIAGIRYWKRQEETVYRYLAPNRGIALHNRPVSKQDDRREPSWGYDQDEDVLIVGAEYDNPMQYAVSIARAFACGRTWDRVLTESRVDGDLGNLENLAVSNSYLLRELSNVGWLDRYRNESVGYWELRDAFEQAREDLTDLTSELATMTGPNNELLDDVDESSYRELRGEITSTSLGLIGSMTMLLWLAGVDVVRVAKIPEYNRNFTGENHTDRRNSLAHHLAMQAAVCSQHHGQPVYRQRYEHRESKQRRAIDPRPDVGSAIGHQLGQVLVVGPGVETLEAELEDHLTEPVEPRDDAADIATNIPIRTTVPRTTYAELVNWRLQDKGGLRPSKQAINLLRAFLPDPRDGVEALRWLSPELTSRGVRLDEVRYAIARSLEAGAIDENRFLPDVTPAARAIVRELLKAGRPLTGTEVHERANISAQSWRNHRDTLAQLKLIAEFDQGWRLTIPFDVEETEQVLREIDQRTGDISNISPDGDTLVNVAAPWYILSGYAVASDLLEDVLIDRMPPAAMADPEHPVASVFFQPPIRPWHRVWETYPELKPWFRIARALTAAPDPADRNITMGVQYLQLELAAFSTPTQTRGHLPRGVGDD